MYRVINYTDHIKIWLSPKNFWILVVLPMKSAPTGCPTKLATPKLELVTPTLELVTPNEKCLSVWNWLPLLKNA